MSTNYASYYLESKKILEQACHHLINDNLISILEYLYQHQEQEPYRRPEIRLAITMPLINCSHHQLLPLDLSNLIIKDIETLRKNDQYLSQWANPTHKRKTLAKDLQIVKQHTEIDDTISLNVSGDPSGSVNPNSSSVLPPPPPESDLHSTISTTTLNVSASAPLPSQNDCLVM